MFLLRRVGFELQGNTAWYKGEIEGKRNYNQGNRSPYYQAPLNCWEHCLVFRKPGGRRRSLSFPVVLDLEGKINGLYGVVGLPSTFLIGRDGRAVALAVGPRDWESAPARAIIEAMLAEPAPVGGGR